MSNKLVELTPKEAETVFEVLKNYEDDIEAMESYDIGEVTEEMQEDAARCAAVRDKIFAIFKL